MPNPLGKIVKSNGHTDYICQIYGTHEADYVPTTEDYALGTFVKIELNATDYLVGLIYDTVLLNPDFGRLGPRLSPENQLNIFSPDYLSERAVLIGIVTLGECCGCEARQGIPRLAANSDALVQPLTSDEIEHFHQVDGRFRVAYLPLLIQRPNPLARHLALTVTRQLAEYLPSQKPLLTVIADDLLWQLHIQGMGER
jgi:hypothetical protein